MRTIALVLIIMLTGIPIILSISTIPTVHAPSAGGTFTGVEESSVEPSATKLANGTIIYHGQRTWSGILSGNCNWTHYETDYPDGSGSFNGVSMFTGSFNGSKSGSMIGHYSGGFSGEGGFNGMESWGGGTGGLTGLQLGDTWIGTANCNGVGVYQSCSSTGTYTVTSATWVSPAPEFSDTALPILVLFTTAASLVILKRRKR